MPKYQSIQFKKNADGWDLTGGATPRKLTISGADIAMAGTGTAVLTFPSATDTLVGRATVDTLLTKTLTAPTISAHTASAGSAMKFISGTALTTNEAGAVEYLGLLAFTNDTTNGRGQIPVEQFMRLNADGSTISTIANFFGATSNIPLVASAVYEIEIFCYFTNTTAGTVTWTFTNSSAPTYQNIHYEMSPLTGIVAPAGSAVGYLSGDIVADATATKALTTTGTLTTAVNHYARFKIFLINNAGTSLKIQATKLVGGTITPLRGSYYLCRRLFGSNVGTFAA